MKASLLQGVAAAIAIATVAGCGAVPPRVGYQSYSADSATSETTGYVFRHRRSVIVIAAAKDSAKLEFEFDIAPDELAPDNTYTPLYRLAGADDAFSTTQLKVSYISNTKLIDEIQVTTKDNLADTISKIGVIAAATGPKLAAGLDTKARTFEPTMIDPWAAGVDQWQVDPLNPRYCMRLRDVAVESELSIDRYVAGAAGRMVGTFPVPACATGVVDIAPTCDGRPHEAKASYSYRVVFAHQRNVVPMPLPSTGSMKMHPICGASVTPADKQDRSSVIDYLAAAIKTAQDVKAARQAKGAAPQKAPAAAKPAAGAK